MPRTDKRLLLDDISWRLLDSLQTDGRAPLKSLAMSAGLSVAATAERIKRLQDARLVRSIVANVDAARAGYAVKAIVGITVPQPGKRGLLDKLRRAPEVLECHHVAGADSYLIMVVAQSLVDLERFLGTIHHFGETHTSIVLSTPIEPRGIVRPSSGRRS